MRKLILIFGLCLLLLMPLVSGALTDGLVDYMSFDDNTSTEYLNLTPVTSTCTISSGVVNSGLDCSGSSQSVIYPYDSDYDFTTGYTYSSWVRLDVKADNQPYVFKGGATAYFTWLYTSGNIDLASAGLSEAHLYVNADNLTTGEWAYLTMVYDGSFLYMYKNGSLISSIASTGTVSTNTDGISLGGYSTNYLNGGIDELYFWNRGLNASEVNELWNDGDILTYPFVTQTTELNDSFESTSIIKQISDVTFSGATQTIVSGVFNITKNATMLYAGYEFEVESTANNVLFCELSIDGVVRGNATRTNDALVLGNAFILTDLLELDIGSYTQELECVRQSGAGQITVSDTVAVTHLLIGEDGDAIPANSTEISTSVTSGASYILIDSFNITTGNKSFDNSTNQSWHVVTESAFTYTNNDGSSDNLSMYVTINNSICALQPRDVSASGSGVVSNDCILHNVSTNQTYQIDVYAKGTNAQYDGVVIAKSFYSSYEEIIGGSGILGQIGYTFSGDEDQIILNATGGNLHHADANTWVKVSYSVKTDLDTTVSFWIKLLNGDNYTTKNFTRDFAAGSTGVLIGQDIIEGLPQDNYSIQLWANCGTVGANCSIEGGSSLGYVTDATTTIFNSFNVTAYDVWDNSSLLTFNVSDGGFYSTTGGVVSIFTTESSLNLNISAPDYITWSFADVNTSENLNASLFQNAIYPQALRIITNTTVTNANFTIGTYTVDYGGYFPISSGNYNVTASAPGFVDKTAQFTFTTLENKTINITGLSDVLLNISNVTDYITGVVLSSWSGWYYNNESGYNDTFSTTSNYQELGIVSGNWTIYVEADGYVNLNDTNIKNLELTGNYNLTTFRLYKALAAYFRFFNESTNTLLQPTEISLTMVNTENGKSNTTTDGTMYFTGLTGSTYSIQYGATDYGTRYYFLELGTNDFSEVDLYLSYENLTANITILIIDENGQNLESAYVKALKYFSATDVYEQVDMGETDSEGETGLKLVKFTDFYKFIIQYDGRTLKTTQPAVITSDSLIIQVNTQESSFSEFFDYTTIGHTFAFNEDTNNFRLVYNDEGGVVQSMCVNVYTLKTNAGKQLYNSSCLTAAAGTILVGVEQVNGTTYYGEAIYNSDQLLATDDYFFPESDVIGSLGLLLQFFITLAFVGVALWDLGLLPIALGASLILGRLMGLTALSWPALLGLFVVMIIISVSIYRGRV